MASLNPVKTVMNIDSSRNSTRQVVSYVGRVVGGASKNVVVETKLKKVLSAIVINETDGAVVATAIAASTAYAGSEKVTFAVANSKEYSYLITGLLSRAATSDTISADTTVTCNPLNSD